VFYSIIVTVVMCINLPLSGNAGQQGKLV